MLSLYIFKFQNSCINFVTSSSPICYVFITVVSDRKGLYRLSFYFTLIKNSRDTVCIVNIRD